MGKVKMLNRISIDGFFASSNEAAFGMDWFIHDPEVDQAAHVMGGRMDTLILGRATYRLFESFWLPVLHDPEAPSHEKAIAEELTEMTKVVFSRTLEGSAWANTRICRDDPAEAVEQLKRSLSSDILILGSGSIVSQLGNKGLIDEYIFIVTPVVAGGGRPLFSETGPLGLRLLNAQTFQSGNAVLHYEVKK